MDTLQDEEPPQPRWDDEDYDLLEPCEACQRFYAQAELNPAGLCDDCRVRAS